MPTLDIHILSWGPTITDQDENTCNLRTMNNVVVVRLSPRRSALSHTALDMQGSDTKTHPLNHTLR